MHGFYRIAAATPALRVADIDHNVREIVTLAKQAAAARAAIVVFPELSLTGYTCGDLFHQTTLLDNVSAGIEAIADALRDSDTIMVVGAPLRYRQRLYNCGVVIQRGTVHGVVPKTFLPNYKEFYEKRWFASGRELRDTHLRLATREVPFGVDLVFQANDQFVVGVELCEDLWSVIPPSSHQALAGATVLVNLSASNDLVAKADYRRELVRGQSARCVAAYVYSSTGSGESTTDLVYGGHALIAENGVLLRENRRFERTPQICFADVDCERLAMTRLSETSYPDNAIPSFRSIHLHPVYRPETIERHIDAHPFVPSDPALRDERCREIVAIQSSGLAARVEFAGAQSLVIGVSGGLDSTLALLVARDACTRLNRDARCILAVSMPGFGTSERTLRSARVLAAAVGAEYREIPIHDACALHLRDIGYAGDRTDRTFENVQARERTQVLMDLANQTNGMVIGTGDLSEIALGWSTYNGDHISMYAVNCTVPKTLIRYVIGWMAEQGDDRLRAVLLEVLDTPVTPELLPAAANGEIEQRTEDLIGPYELHDFFLYHLLKYGARPAKVKFLAAHAFRGTYSEETIAKWLRVFIQRFFSQQFKRNCIPDGPKVGSIALSPRGDWRMPSDAVASEWLKEI